jgi:hypothetical protein
MAMEMVKVVPGPGRVVRLEPGAKPMKATGATVPLTLLIRKWIANGDLVMAPAVQTVASPAAQTATAPAKAEPTGAKS